MTDIIIWGIVIALVIATFLAIPWVNNIWYKEFFLKEDGSQFWKAVSFIVLQLLSVFAFHYFKDSTKGNDLKDWFGGAIVFGAVVGSIQLAWLVFNKPEITPKINAANSTISNPAPVPIARPSMEPQQERELLMNNIGLSNGPVRGRNYRQNVTNIMRGITPPLPPLNNNQPKQNKKEKDPYGSRPEFGMIGWIELE